MYGKLRFQLTKGTVEAVGGVWNMELWVLLIDEEEGQISFQAFVCAADTLVRVVPAVAPFDAGLLIDERAPLPVPRDKLPRELFFFGFGQRQRQRAQLFARRSLRPPRQVLGHLLDLVKLADLDGDILENR